MLELGKQVQNNIFFKTMEFALKYGIWELLRHVKIPETHVLVTLLTGNAWLFNGKKSLAYQVSRRYFRILRFLEVCVTHV